MKPYLLAAVGLLATACSHPAREIDISGAPAPQATPAGVNFAGTWVYDPDDSDQPGRYGMGGASTAFGGRGGFGGERGGFGGGRTGRGSRGPTSGDGGDDRDATDSLIRQPAGRLVILQTDSTVTISPRDQTLYTLFFDGRDVTMTDQTGRNLMLNGRCHGKQFEVRRTLHSGAQLTEKYELKKNGQRLVVHVRIQRTDSETAMPEFQRVYDKYGQ